MQSNMMNILKAGGDDNARKNLIEKNKVDPVEFQNKHQIRFGILPQIYTRFVKNA